MATTKAEASTISWNRYHDIWFTRCGRTFYTYISSLHYIMGLRENNIPLIILDRPNPNGNVVDGPILEKNIQVLLVCIQYQFCMAWGEYGQMINGEKWLKNKIQCKLLFLVLITIESNYSLPVKPSPNLRMTRRDLYASLCLFWKEPV
jgi:hypothetical protein